MPKYVEVIGKKYGLLLILDDYKSNHKGGRSCRRLKCLCDCGNETHPVKEKVLKGVTKSCGCLQTTTRKGLGMRNFVGVGTASFNDLYSSYKRGALNRGYIFELTKDYFSELVVKPCLYCGDTCKTTHISKGAVGSYSYTGIDRFDNTLGYTVENSVPCCKICNQIKLNYSAEFLHNHLQKIYKHNPNFWKRTT